MQKHRAEIFGKISLLSIGIILIIQGVSYSVTTQATELSGSYNQLSYQSANSQSLSEVGVALGTGIGVRFDSQAYNNVTSYSDNGKVGETSTEAREIRKELIAQNMVIVKEYLSLVKTDTIKLLDSSNTRRTTLNTFISQLELRFKNASISQSNLQAQKDLLIADMRIIQSDIDNVKTKISSDFTANEVEATLADVDEYLELRRRYRENFTDIVFINQFLVQYNFLNNYNKNLLDTLINNKEALINKSFVVIPDSGDQLLKEFNLLYEEAEFKEITQ